jgi:hypothetical protein
MRRIEVTEGSSPESEVENEDWNYEVVRTYVLGVELLDLNISAIELRLLLVLRSRASGGRNNHVSNETLAKDLGLKPNAIAKHMVRLAQQNYIVCKSRGWATPTLKTIKSMTQRFDKDILQMSRKDIFGSGRSEELLERLHHPTNNRGKQKITSDKKGNEDNIDNSLCTDIDNEDDHGENSPFTTQNSDQSRCESVTLEAPKKVIKLHQELYLKKLDTTPFGRARKTETILSKEEDPDSRSGKTTSLDEEDTDCVELGGLVLHKFRKEEKKILKNSDSSDDQRLGIAIAAQAKASARSAEIAQERQRMLSARKDRDEKSGLAAERRMLREQQRSEDKTAGGKFYEWAKNEYDQFFPGVKMMKWMKTEFSQLKILTDACHGNDDLVREAWSYLCENWDELSKKLKLFDSVPTIGLLLAIRARIVPLVQKRKTARQVAETQSAGKELGEW